MNRSKSLITVLNQALIPMILVVVIPTAILGWVAAGTFDVLSLIMAIFIISTMDLGGNALNNYADWKIDELNEKRKELHTQITKKKLLLISIVLFALSLPFLAIGNIYLRAVILIGYLIAINYSIVLKTKNIPIANYVTISLYYGPLAFAYGFLSSTADVLLLAKIAWMMAFLFLIDMGFSVTKDYEDIKGDKAENKLTLPVIYGKKASLAYQFAMITSAFFLLAALIVLKVVSYWYSLAFISYVIAAYALWIVHSTESRERFHHSHNLIRLNALICRFLLAFITAGIHLRII